MMRGLLTFAGVAAIVVALVGCGQRQEAGGPPRVTFSGLAEGKRFVDDETRRSALHVAFFESSPKIDGELGEWAGLKFHALDESHLCDYKTWGGVKDLGLKFALAYDLENIYLGVVVADDKHVQHQEGDGAWSEDCIQFAFDPLNDDADFHRPDDLECTAALLKTGAALFTYNFRNDERKNLAEHCQIAVTRATEETVYECAIPFRHMSPLAPFTWRTMGFDIVAQDVDGGDDNGRLELAQGIWSAKRPSRYRDVYFEPPPGAPRVAGFVELQDPNVEEADTVVFDAYLLTPKPTETCRLSIGLEKEGKEGSHFNGQAALQAGVNHLMTSFPARDLEPGVYGVSAVLSVGDDILCERSWRLSRLRPEEQLLERCGEVLKGLNAFRKQNPNLPDSVFATVGFWLAAVRASESLERTDAVASKAESLLVQAEHALEVMKSGRDPFVGRTGCFTKAYRSEYDGTLQPYNVWLPRDFNPAKTYPLIVKLHSYGGPGYSKFGFALAEGHARESEAADAELITVMPYARGNEGYRGFGEIDVMNVIREIKKAYHIDEDRTYLRGSSMGGSGTWVIGLKYPQMWAALNPGCGSAGAYRPQTQKELAEAPRWRRYLAERGRACLLAGNGMNVPVFFTHGDSDPIVSVENSRAMNKAFTVLGHPCFVYEEVPGGMHGTSTMSIERAIKWMMQYKRNPWPKRTAVVSCDLNYCRTYWLEVSRLERFGDWAKVLAAVTGDDRISVVADKALEFSLHLDRPLVSGRNLLIEVNGDKIHLGEVGLPAKIIVGKNTSGAWQALEKSFTNSASFRKKHGLSGPIEEAFRSPFLIVYGTKGGDEARTKQNRDDAYACKESMTGCGWGQIDGDIPIKPDTEVVPEDIAKYNLILYGTDETNSIVADILPELPVRFRDETIVFAGKSYSGENVGMQMVYPNPSNRDRYIVLRATPGSAGLGKFGLDRRAVPDFIIVDATLRYPDQSKTLTAGLFNDRWELDETSE